MDEQKANNPPTPKRQGERNARPHTPPRQGTNVNATGADEASLALRAVLQGYSMSESPQKDNKLFDAPAYELDRAGDSSGDKHRDSRSYNVVSEDFSHGEIYHVEDGFDSLDPTTIRSRSPSTRSGYGQYANNSPMRAPSPNSPLPSKLAHTFVLQPKRHSARRTSLAREMLLEGAQLRTFSKKGVAKLKYISITPDGRMQWSSKPPVKTQAGVSWSNRTLTRMFGGSVSSVL